MTNEELLKPRFKVIEDYPHSWLNIGEIVENTFDTFDLKYYPHIFKELEWWEERSLGDLPKYLKLNKEIKTGYISINDEEEPFIHKVKVHFRYSTNTHFRYSSYKEFVSEWRDQPYNYNQFLPSTEEEYLINFKK